MEALVNAGDLSYRVVLSDPDDYIQSFLLRDGVPYEWDMLRDAAARNDGLMLDVGANIGNHTLFWGASGFAVVAFEPDASLTSCLEASALLNEMRGVSVRSVALGSETGVCRLEMVDPTNIGMQQAVVGEGDIPVVRLDDLELSGVGTLKVDVEGMELDVLQGASSTIRRDLPNIYVEAVGDQHKKVKQFLASFGYSEVRRFNATPTYLFVHSDKQ